jgi:colicin import membrane protein
MNRLVREDSRRPEQAEEDPFRYGWRYVRSKLPDGREVVDQVPLSWEDVLYPEEDDVVINDPIHLRDFMYCHGALETFYNGRSDVVVLGDCRVDWGVEGVRPLGPDVLVLFEVRQWRQARTFRIAQEGGRPILVVEIASPSTWEHDLYSKPDLYYRAGVQRYVIVDRGPEGEDPPRLLGYQRGAQGWDDLPLDAEGRLDLAPVPLRLGLEGDRPRLYDAATGQMLPDRTELTQALAEAEERERLKEVARVKAEKKAQRETKARARLAKKAEDEVKAREEAEKEARKAEREARKAEKEARKEAKAREKAEARARQEAEARAALEQRLRELEEQLRQRREES